jgi:hypothetical protein
VDDIWGAWTVQDKKIHEAHLAKSYSNAYYFSTTCQHSSHRDASLLSFRNIFMWYVKSFYSGLVIDYSSSYSGLFLLLRFVTIVRMLLFLLYILLGLFSNRSFSTYLLKLAHENSKWDIGIMLDENSLPESLVSNRHDSHALRSWGV